MSDKSIEERKAALKERVQSQLQASQDATEQRALVSSEELVVSVEDVDAAVELAAEKTKQRWLRLEEDERGRWRTIAASLILLGSLLGMMSGALILQGNPSDIISSSFFISTDSVDVIGTAIQAEEGTEVENVTVELIEIDTNTVLRTVKTDANGLFVIDNVISKLHILKLSKEGYNTMELKIIPEKAGVGPITMSYGDDTITRDHHTVANGWDLENAVGLSTTIGILTVITGIVGVQAAVEVRRGKYYRRTQYLAGISLFSRGLIIFGPALILAGMITMVFIKEQFDDYQEE
ncbi:MAG: carboxypeptidase-like regulatory domain-containing protein [Candidatus Poseidoniaceae archaeon]|nr:carboxypeptidase-like regulatory domain-containing protein [Candidatus Poseidoniaceae archaeon]